MEPDRVDLSALDPRRDELGYERLVRRILTAAGPELERRARAAGPLALVAGWAKPTLAAAAVIAAVAVAAIAATDRGVGTTAEPATMVEALGVPAPAADWLEDGRGPTRSDLVVAMESRR
jgi:hypothetical protein